VTRSRIAGAFHAALERPRVFRTVGSALAPGAERALFRRIRAEIATARPGTALDVGCGPRSRLERAGAASIGVDISLAYVRALTSTGTRGVVACARALPFREDAFSSAWSFGLLHHLSDADARRALFELDRVTGTGKCVVFDSVLPERAWRRPIAWAIRRLDRGRHLRAEATFRALIGAPPVGVSGSRSRWRVSRETYSWTGLEGLWCVHDPSETERTSSGTRAPRSGGHS
jgi:hypothetical protein